MNFQMKSIYEFLLKSKTAVSTQGIGYVDLGLKSGLLWARCNIGADEPTDYGDYFMWGSTEPDTDKPCDWEHAPFNDGKNKFDFKYFKSIQDDVCPNGILSPKYDAATVILGDDWRLPTADDFKELMNNTNNYWVDDYYDSNINGRIFKSKINEIELFIPASGCRAEYNFINRGSDADLWSSSLNTTNPHYAKDFYSEDSSCYINRDIRYAGFCLRGVK